MKIQSLASLLFIVILVSFGCSDNSMDPETEVEALSESEQIVLIATETVQQTGGMMADLEMVISTAAGRFTTLAKPSSLDTTISAGWLTFELALGFFNERGIEQPTYVPGLTDSLAYQGRLTGSYHDGKEVLEIDLSTVSSFAVADIKSGRVTIDGSGANHSTYQVSGNRRTLNVAPTSTYKIEQAVVDLNSGEIIPQSGKATGTISGVFTVTTAGGSQEKDYEFTFTLEFNGTETAIVTLPGGKTINLNLKSGEIS